MSSSRAGSEASFFEPKPACRGTCFWWPDRGKSTASMRAFGGKLDFYGKKCGFFQVTCGNEVHGKCALTRTARKLGSLSDAAPVGGRPLGFMSYCLNSFVESREEHWSAEGPRCSVRPSSLIGKQRVPN